MAIKIGGNNAIDNNRRATINGLSVASYTSAQLASGSYNGSTAGDIVYASDLEGGTLVAWSGNK